VLKVLSRRRITKSRAPRFRVSKVVRIKNLGKSDADRVGASELLRGYRSRSQGPQFAWIKRR
jgi:hypothetical protein